MEISDSRTVLYCLPANTIFQKFGFEFWYFQMPRLVWLPLMSFLDHWLISFLSFFVCMNSLRVPRLFLSFCVLTFVSWLFLAKPFSLTSEYECVWLVKNQWLVESWVAWSFLIFLLFERSFFLCNWKDYIGLLFIFVFIERVDWVCHCLIGFLFSVLLLS